MKTLSIDQEQAGEIGKILEHLGQTDQYSVVVWEGEVGLASKDGVYMGKAWWNSDTEMWLFMAAETP